MFKKKINSRIPWKLHSRS